MTKQVRQTGGKAFQNRLAQKIADEIETRGPITFERFMERALYDPDFGYYARGARIGKGTDFYTSPTAHRAFGAILARVISRMRKRLRRENGAEKFSVIEAGGGNGTLALDILDELARTDPETCQCVEYILVDRSFGQSRKCIVGERENFCRARSFAQIKRQAAGIIISNELFDAVPFHRLAFRNGRIKEIFVSVKQGEFTEIEAEPSTEKLADYFDRCGGAEKMGFAEGRAFEISTGAAELLSSMSDCLEKGAILTADYGFRTEELFSPKRHTGTFKCVSGHRINENPYQNIGEQDITAHVDFGNLEAAGKGSGLATLKYTTQGQFLVDWGIMEIAEQNPDEILAVKNLFMPQMMGDKFRILLQIKNADELKEGFYPTSPLKISFGIA